MGHRAAEIDHVDRLAVLQLGIGVFQRAAVADIVLIFRQPLRIAALILGGHGTVAVILPADEPGIGRLHRHSGQIGGFIDVVLAGTAHGQRLAAVIQGIRVVGGIVGIGIAYRAMYRIGTRRLGEGQQLAVAAVIGQNVAAALDGDVLELLHIGGGGSAGIAAVLTGIPVGVQGLGILDHLIGAVDCHGAGTLRQHQLPGGLDVQIQILPIGDGKIPVAEIHQRRTAGGTADDIKGQGHILGVALCRLVAAKQDRRQGRTAGDAVGTQQEIELNIHRLLIQGAVGGAAIDLHGLPQHDRAVPGHRPVVDIAEVGAGLICMREGHVVAVEPDGFLVPAADDVQILEMGGTGHHHFVTLNRPVAGHQIGAPGIVRMGLHHQLRRIGLRHRILCRPCRQAVLRLIGVCQVVIVGEPIRALHDVYVGHIAGAQSVLIDGVDSSRHRRRRGLLGLAVAGAAVLHIIIVLGSSGAQGAGAAGCQTEAGQQHRQRQHKAAHRA